MNNHIRPYRGKRKDNGEWIYGWAYSLNHAEHAGKVFIIPKYASAPYSIEVHPETVGQYTGLRDKKGKEIYEGDIAVVTYGKCRVTDINGLTRIGQVIYERAAFLVSIKDSAVRVSFYDVNRFEIIGNRFDHPNLLEERV